MIVKIKLTSSDKCDTGVIDEQAYTSCSNWSLICVSNNTDNDLLRSSMLVVVVCIASVISIFHVDMCLHIDIY